MPEFRIEYEAADGTVGGIFGARPDVNRQLVRGIAHYYVDGREVTQADYVAALARTKQKKARDA
jgi:hypothetical protein